MIDPIHELAATRRQAIEYQPQMFSPELIQAARNLIDCCLKRHLMLVLAESCTGGLLGAALTALPGASRVVDRAYVVYSNESKSQELGVATHLIDEYGAVSSHVAVAMAAGALARTQGRAQISIAITGVAGPAETAAKPVGLVHIAVAGQAGTLAHEQHEFGPLGRDQVRENAVLAALDLAASWADRVPQGPPIASDQPRSAPRNT